MMKLGIPKEIFPDEKRVAATPASVLKLIKLGYEVIVESSAGKTAHYEDQDFIDAGASISEKTEDLWAQADFILKVRAPMINPDTGTHEVKLMKKDAYIVSYIWPAENSELLDDLASKGTTVFAIDSLPRISRAQKIDRKSVV